ncbi:MAG: glycosyltransferase family 39 protein [Thermodesulfobacteriota bacterium]
MPASRIPAAQKGLLHREGVLLLCSCLFIVLAYFPTFFGDFILDDRPFVKDNPYIQEFHSPISYLSQQDGILTPHSGKGHSGYYRPLTNATYSLDFKIWGLNPAGFRATNLALHLLACILLYLCMRKIVKGTGGPLFAILLFGLHPVNTEAVSWVASRNNILVTLFCLGAFYFYLKRKEDGATWQGLPCLGCFSLALLSKEFAGVFLPILAMCDAFLGPGVRRFRKLLWGYLAFLAILLAYAAARNAALQGLVPWSGRSVEDLLKALWFAPFLILENLRIVFLPWGLHNFMITYPEDWMGREALLGFAGMILLFWLLWRGRDRRQLLFSSLSFLIALVPVLHFLPTSVQSVVSMRWLYFPMSFLALAGAWGFRQMEGSRRRSLGHGLGGIILVYFGVYTFILNNNLWKNEENFFHREVVLFQNHFYAGDLARIYHRRGNLAEAERCYRTAEGNRLPDRIGMLINYAALLVETNRPAPALTYLEQAENLEPDGAGLGMIFNNRGAAYFNMKDYGKAIESLRKAAIYSGDDPAVLSNLEKAYDAAGEPGMAAPMRRRARPLHPDSQRGSQR